MQDFEMVMNNTIKREFIKKFLDKVFKIYKGKLRIKEKPEKEISTSRKHYGFALEKEPIIIFLCYYTNCLELSLEMPYLTTWNKSYEQVKENFLELIDLAIAMMKASDNDYFIGSFEAGGIIPKQDVPIQVLFFKDEKYLPYLQEHVKFAFNVDVEINKLREMVNKFATMNKEYGDYKLICFYPFFTKEKVKSYFSVKFYNEIKKLREELNNKKDD